MAGAQPSELSESPRSFRRADAVASRERILSAAVALAGESYVSMGQIAAAAGVGRSTLYRHFPTREALREALSARRRGSVADRGVYERGVTQVPAQAPGQLGRGGPLTVEVTRVLDDVPPHLVPDQLVAEARRVGRVPVALYVADIDGSQLVRLAGSDEFPESIESPPALGPEIVPEGLPSFYDQLTDLLPGCVIEPLWLRGRVIGLFLSVGAPVGSLEDLARQGAAALELAGGYTDFFEMVRRHKPTTPAAEIQQNLFPPRIARVAGAQLAGTLLPSYEVGGDWFDFVENRDGAWLAIADSCGTGPTAAGIGAAALGALRAARRAGGDLEQATRAMHQTIRRLDHPDFFITVFVARWRAATGTLTWVNCGHPPAYVVDRAGELSELEGPVGPPLGQGEAVPDLEVSERRLGAGERLVLVTDGVLDRRTREGKRFGADGLQAAIDQADHPTAALTALAVQEAVRSSCQEPLDDDATVVVLALL